MQRIVFTALVMMIALQSEAAEPVTGNAQRYEGNMGSTYVPIESWVYPALDRLIAAGYVQTAFEGLRPWTRMDCARLLEEADELTAHDSAASTVGPILKVLHREFAAELERRDGANNREARIDSVDQRSTYIAGRPITDGYHFAETQANDYGRPFGRGLNSYTGVSARAAAGPFAAYIRLDLQHAPFSGDSPDSSAQTAIAAADFTPAAAAGPSSGFTRGRLLDANVSFTFKNNQFTFGRQSLWWGPGRSGPMLYSNNAEPLTMMRYDRILPIELPALLKLLGPIRWQFFVGRLGGQQFVHPGSSTLGSAGIALKDQPFLQGEKFSFKPSPNLEFSVSRTGIFGGAGSPVTISSFARSLFSTRNATGPKDPGDRRSAFDAEYRIPGLRTCLTTYVDTFTDDEPFPLAYPTESAWSPGFLLSCLPHLPKATLRAEGVLTPHRDLFPGFYYFNVHYLSGYTNDRQLIGSWIGREGEGGQVWGTWWLSPRSSLEASVRTVNASGEFLRGGTLRDLSVTADVAMRPEWQLQVTTQVDRWDFQLLSATSQYNIATTVQISFKPRSRTR